MNGPSHNAYQQHALRSSLMADTEKHRYQRCLVNNDCTTKQPVIGGHAIPKNHMQRLPGSNTMKVFTKRRFGRPENELPLNEGINDATVGYFTCKRHDDMFQEVDLLADITAMPKQRTLDLMCYRNILYSRWWMHLWAQASERARYEHAAERQYEIAKSLRTDDPVMLASQMAIERSIGLGEGPHRPYLHLVLSSHGKPMLAAAVFGVLQGRTNGATHETSDELGQWGPTLVPGHDTNTLFLHFPADTGTQVINMVLPSLARGRSTVPGKEVTRAILSSCRDVVFSEDSWSSLPSHERADVISAMMNHPPTDNWTTDIFNGSEWEPVPSELPETDSN